MPHTWVHTCSTEGWFEFTFFSSFQGAEQSRWDSGPWGVQAKKEKGHLWLTGKALPQEAHVHNHSNAA